MAGGQGEGGIVEAPPVKRIRSQTASAAKLCARLMLVLVAVALLAVPAKGVRAATLLVDDADPAGHPLLTDPFQHQPRISSRPAAKRRPESLANFCPCYWHLEAL